MSRISKLHSVILAGALLSVGIVGAAPVPFALYGCESNEVPVGQIDEASNSTIISFTNKVAPETDKINFTNGVLRLEDDKEVIVIRAIQRPAGAKQDRLAIRFITKNKTEGTTAAEATYELEGLVSLNGHKIEYNAATNCLRIMLPKENVPAAARAVPAKPALTAWQQRCQEMARRRALRRSTTGSTPVRSGGGCANGRCRRR